MQGASRSAGTTFAVDILELAVAIELACSGLYDLLAERFANDAEFSTFWRLYAEAERYHAATLRLHQAAFVTTPVEGDSFPTETEASRAFLDQLHTWRRTLLDTPPTAAEALDLAKKMESSAAELHGRTQFFRLYPAFREVFARIVEEDADHRQRLDDAVTRWVTP